MVKNIAFETIIYYPFGMPMPGREFESGNKYRFGFNKGSEKDDEISGDGNNFTTFYREGDTRLATWWSPDPKTKEQPWQSPYSFMDGNPIKNNDPNGDIVPPWLVGAGVGAVLDLAVQSVEIAFNDKKTFSEHFSFASVGVSAVAGATGAGLTSKIAKLGILYKIAIEASVDATSSAAHQTVTEGNVDFTKVAEDVIVGQTLGNAAKSAVVNKVEKQAEAKVLARKVDRMTRVAGDKPRPSRAYNLKQYHRTYDNYVTNRGASASAAASGIGSKIVESILDLNDNDSNKKSTNRK